MATSTTLKHGRLRAGRGTRHSRAWGAIVRQSDDAVLRLGVAADSPGDDMSWRAASIACTRDAVYVQHGVNLQGYAPTGETFRVPVPGGLVNPIRAAREARGGDAYYAWYGSLSSDGAGNLVLTTPGWMATDTIIGALISPVEGCAALLLDRSGDRALALVGVHRDSAVVVERHRSLREVDGRRISVIEPYAGSVSLRPLRMVRADNASNPDAFPQDPCESRFARWR